MALNNALNNIYLNYLFKFIYLNFVLLLNLLLLLKSSQYFHTVHYVVISDFLKARQNDPID